MKKLDQVNEEMAERFGLAPGCCCSDGDAMCLDCLKGDHQMCRTIRKAQQIAAALPKEQSDG